MINNVDVDQQIVSLRGIQKLRLDLLRVVKILVSSRILNIFIPTIINIISIHTMTKYSNF